MSAIDDVKQLPVRSREFLEECWAELKKVHWPTTKETQAATMAVIFGVVIVATYLGLLDFTLARLLQWVLS